MSTSAIKRTVLVFLFSEDERNLLMIHKKQGQGAGKINVPGGKVQDGENEAVAAIRECKEECGLHPLNLQVAGKLEFYFPESNSWDNLCTVFRARGFTGVLTPETEECTSSWIPINQIPFEKMWDSDRIWAPLLLQGKFFHRAYVFDKDDMVREETVIT